MSDSESRKEARDSAQGLAPSVASDASKTPTGPWKTVTVAWAGKSRDDVNSPTTNRKCEDHSGSRPRGYGDRLSRMG